MPLLHLAAVTGNRAVRKVSTKIELTAMAATNYSRAEPHSSKPLCRSR